MYATCQWSFSTFSYDSVSDVRQESILLPNFMSAICYQLKLFPSIVLFQMFLCSTSPYTSGYCNLGIKFSCHVILGSKK
jgi:hypothetical protein